MYHIENGNINGYLKEEEKIYYHKSDNRKNLNFKKLMEIALNKNKLLTNP